MAKAASTTGAVPRYRVLATAYIHDRIYEEGEEADFTGPPAEHLEPLNAAARAAVEAAPRPPAGEAI